ncbi:hypothetical protein RSW32_25435, partial [Escherichia coli]|uniref:hypothetical protein n=1 Tax=Escherichia coli TaxID=562 RepID=UPI0028DDA60B|nr:hypothetical protein [Escherichia coli]
AGQAATHAANVGQVQQSGQAALASANNFTTQQVAALQPLMNQAFANGLCSFAGGGVSCGGGAAAQGSGATAIGAGAQATGDNTTALG